MAVELSDLIYLPISENSIIWALETACKKFKYRQSRRQYDRIDRSNLTALDDKVRGDLAKNAIIEWLQNNGVSDINEYDKVRKDNFRNQDGDWDFLVKKIQIEVKSSLPYRMESNNRIIDIRDVKIIAKRAGESIKMPLNLTCDVFIQIYFRTSLLSNAMSLKDILAMIDEDNYKDIRDLIQADSRLMEPIAFAWATKEDVDNFRTGSNDFWSYSGFTYWKCPICDSGKIVDLPHYLSSV